MRLCSDMGRLSVALRGGKMSPFRQTIAPSSFSLEALSRRAEGIASVSLSDRQHQYVRGLK